MPTKDPIPRRRAIGFNNAGRALYFKGDKKGALDYFERSIAADKSFGAPYHYRGVTLRDLNRRDDAREMFEMAIALDQQNVEAVNQGLGLLLLADEKWEPARRRALCVGDASGGRKLLRTSTTWAARGAASTSTMTRLRLSKRPWR